MSEDQEKANVTQIFKKVKEDTKNYRPVSFTSVSSKVMEQLILETISRHIKYKKIIRNSHHGSTVRVTRKWHRLPRKAVKSPSLEIVKSCLDMILGNSL